MLPEQPDTAVSVSLTRESARLVRADRVVRAQPNPVARAVKRGYLDYMLNLPKPEWITFDLESHYRKGLHNGKQFRDILTGRGFDWQETVIEKSGSSWTWAIYREGYCLASGKAPSEKKAGQAAELARVDPRRQNSPTEQLEIS